VDAVAKDGDIVVWAVSEHVEKAGVHSGDATLVFPPQNTYLETVRRLKRTTNVIAKALKITGPFNIQYLAKDNEIKVIECNLRASRSFPFVSKVSKTNFIDLATTAMAGGEVPRNISLLDMEYVGVKSPQFSFTRLRKADPITGVEMASTGEVASLGGDLNSAFLKSILSAGMRMPKRDILVSIGGEQSKYKLLESMRKLADSGYRLYATDSTSDVLTENSIPNVKVRKSDGRSAISLIERKEVDFAIIIPSLEHRKESTDGYLMRRKAVDYAIPLITDLSIARLFTDAICKLKVEELKIKAWDEYG
jgi:carbamoyl-phosphate synthase large subunit